MADHDANENNISYFKIDVPETSTSYLTKVKDGKISDMVMIEGFGASMSIHNIVCKKPLTADQNASKRDFEIVSKDELHTLTDYGKLKEYFNRPQQEFLDGHLADCKTDIKPISKDTYFKTAAIGIIRLIHKHTKKGGGIPENVAMAYPGISSQIDPDTPLGKALFAAISYASQQTAESRKNKPEDPLEKKSRMLAEAQESPKVNDKLPEQKRAAALKEYYSL